MDKRNPWILALALTLAIPACRDEPRPSGDAIETTAPAPASAQAEGTKLLPVDEADRDPSFAAFRAELLAAVRQKDADALLAKVDPSIRTTFGNGGGRDDLAKRWEIRESGSRLWGELEWVLTHGGSFRGEGDDSRMFWAPYVYSAWPDSEDPFTTLAVIGTDVPMRAEPRNDAAAIASLSHAIVRIASDPRDGWRRVATSGGTEGWVETRWLRSHLDLRAGFAKRDGTWSMTAFVSGD